MLRVTLEGMIRDRTSHSLQRRRVKVVGHDGSANGPNVVEGAARRLAPGDRLVIVHALESESATGDSVAGHGEVRQRILDSIDPSVLDSIEYELRVVDGPPAQALIDVALDTEAIGIVVGTRRGPSRIGQRTIRSELESGPVPVVALFRTAERESHPDAQPIDRTHRQGHDSFPASDPPSSWSEPPKGALPNDGQPKLGDRR